MFIFTPKHGEDESNLAHIFQMGWFNHQPGVVFSWVFKEMAFLGMKKKT